LPWATHEEKAKYRLSAYFAPEFRQFLRRFRSAARGGIGVDTRGDIRGVIALYLAGCPRVASLSHYLGSDVAVPAFAARVIPFDADCRRWEMNARFLEMLDAGGVAGRIAPPSFPHLAGSARAGQVAGLVAVAPWTGKLWVPERWSELIAALREVGFEAVSFCGPGQETLAREQTGGVPTTFCRSIEDWARTLSRCRLVVTLDTGPMHLADALGVPVIALFGTGLLPLWAPSSGQSVVISHQDAPDFAVCQPVEENTGLGRKFMGRISSGEVIEAARAVLRNR
jgi:ADP-heptose:LPS heptosyltransferase